jgi:hypothetical protein
MSFIKISILILVSNIFYNQCAESRENDFVTLDCKDGTKIDVPKIFIQEADRYSPDPDKMVDARLNCIDNHGGIKLQKDLL